MKTNDRQPAILQALHDTVSGYLTETILSEGQPEAERATSTWHGTTRPEAMAGIPISIGDLRDLSETHPGIEVETRFGIEPLFRFTGEALREAMTEAVRWAEELRQRGTEDHWCAGWIEQRQDA